MSIEVEMRDESNGIKKWFIKGTDILHREDGPAVEHSDGTKYWCLNDKFHREDGPAIEWFDGTKEWYQNGHLHREDGPAVVEANNSKEWWINGKKLDDGQIIKLKAELKTKNPINSFFLLMSGEG